MLAQEGFEPMSEEKLYRLFSTSTIAWSTLKATHLVLATCEEVLAVGERVHLPHDHLIEVDDKRM
jgi:hypothetical protein